MDNLKENNKTPLGLSYKMEITARTPVHIGCSDSLSPLTDYIITENKRVHLIDSDKFNNLLISKNQIDNFINSVKRNVNEAKFDFLKDFVENILKVPIEDVCDSVSYPINFKGNPVEIHRFVSTSGSAFIPGSSIKGAIRSAMLYKWLIDPQNKNAVSQWLETLERVYDDRRIKIKDKIEILEKDFNFFIEEKCFGALKPKRNDRAGNQKKSEDRLALSCLRIGDTNLIQSSEMAAYEICRFRLDSNKDDIPVIKECFEIGKSCFTKLSIDYSTIARNIGEYPPILINIASREQIYELINAYSRDVLDYEKNVILYDAFENKELAKYKKNIESLSEDLGNENKVAYLRLGQGKMQFYQTIALVIFKLIKEDEEAEKWIHYLNYCAGFPRDGIEAIYPITRALTTINQLPLGWLKIRFLD